MQLAERMSRLGTESAFEVLARAKALEAEGREVIHLGGTEVHDLVIDPECGCPTVEA